MIFDAATEGKHVIIGMLVTGLIFLVVIGLGELVALGEPPPRTSAPRSRPGVLAAVDCVSMAIARDLREWIALLEREGELVRVSAEVDPHLEVTEIVDRTVKAGGPALLFERPKGAQHPLLINQFGTERRMCLAFGVERLDDIGASSARSSSCSRPKGSRRRCAA